MEGHRSINLFHTVYYFNTYRVPLKYIRYGVECKEELNIFQTLKKSGLLSSWGSSRDWVPVWALWIWMLE